MKNLIMVFVILDLCCLNGLAYKFYKKLYNLKSNKNIQYEYTDIYGNKGYSRHCYNQYNNFICRKEKKGIRVSKYERKDI